MDVDASVLDMSFFWFNWITSRSAGCCLLSSGNMIFLGLPGSPREVMDVDSCVLET